VNEYKSKINTNIIRLIKLFDCRSCYGNLDLLKYFA